MYYYVLDNHDRFASDDATEGALFCGTQHNTMIYDFILYFVMY
jgi:hypothetical protein